jgi:hypothetical protein
MTMTHINPAPLTLPNARVSSAGASARLLIISFAFGAAAVPAFVVGQEGAGWGLALLSLSLALRFPMAGLCATLGGGAYLLLTAVALLDPAALGASGLAQADPGMRMCAWLTLVASVAAVCLLDVPTFQQTFRREGRPLATWTNSRALWPLPPRHEQWRP